MPDNIERAAFPTPRKQYVGYGRGIVWCIYQVPSGNHWEAVDQARGPHFERAPTLAALSVKIADKPADIRIRQVAAMYVVEDMRHGAWHIIEELPDWQSAQEAAKQYRADGWNVLEC
jgi:hypothetical protein